LHILTVSLFGFLTSRYAKKFLSPDLFLARVHDSLASRSRNGTLGPVTDSGWFWALSFAVMALVGNGCLDTFMAAHNTAYAYTCTIGPQAAVPHCPEQQP